MLLRRIQEDNKPDPWAMTDADIVVYDKAFVKQDKDKDGFISLHGQCLVKPIWMLHRMGSTEFVVLIFEVALLVSGGFPYSCGNIVTGQITHATRIKLKFSRTRWC